jgi:O-antigen/teichoic acid export membrane protein
MADIIRQLGKNIFSSWSSFAVRALLVFLVNPFIIHTLGNDRYGVWILAISIINYMTILDLGLKQSLIRYISMYLGLDDYERVNSVLNTAFLLYIIIALIAVVLTFILSFFTMSLFRIPPEFLPQARIVLIIIGLSTALNLAMTVWGDSLGAFHRFDIAYGLMMAEDVFRTAAIVILLKNGAGLVPFSLMFFLFNLLRLSIAAAFLKRLHRKVRRLFAYVNRETMRLLFRYGLTAFFISVAWLLIVNTDNVLIAYFLNTASVTRFAIAAGFIVYLRSLIQTVTFPLRPVISHYDALDKKENIVFIYTRATKYLYFLTFAVAGVTVIFADTLIFLWMGSGYTETAAVLKILILPAAVCLPQAVANSVMFGMEKHRYLLYIIIAEGISNLILSIVLVGEFGLYGIAYGTIIPQLVLYLFVMPRVIKIILPIRLSTLYASLLRAAGPALLFSVLISAAVKRIIVPTNWISFFGDIAFIAAALVLLGYAIIDKNELRTIYSKLRQSD